MKKNLERMIALADEVFDVRSDPTQIAVDEQVMEQLRLLHPASLSEESTDDGPIAWVLVVPTTSALMDQFLARAITEREMLQRTPAGAVYDALYLCSALVLPEHRRLGIARRLLLDAVQTIAKDHPVARLFCWPFSAEGEQLARAVATVANLPLSIHA